MQKTENWNLFTRNHHENSILQMEKNTANDCYQIIDVIWKRIDADKTQTREYWKTNSVEIDGSFKFLCPLKGKHLLAFAFATALYVCIKWNESGSFGHGT